MKNISFILFLFVTCNQVFAQWQGTNPVYFNAGNVGIGTSSPSNIQGWDRVLNVEGGPHSKILASSSGNYRVGMYSHSSWNGGGGFIGTESNHPLSFVTNYTARMVLDLNGNLGIGTTSPYSWSKLHIKAPGANPWGILSEASANDKVIGVGHDGTNGIIAVSALSANGYTPLQLWTSNTPRLTIDVPGNIGIGTTAPLSKLHINSSIERETFRIYKQGNTANYLSFWQGTGAGAIDPIGTGQLYLGYDQSTNVIMGYTGAGVNSGNVGIGTPTPDAKLAVKGQIHAQEVKVDLLGSIAPPDYVFASNYQLPTLDYIKTYIDQNKHLPEVPSAKELEANGVNLGEMNMLLLKKIEELTLYVIEQNKLILKQNERIETLERKK